MGKKEQVNKYGLKRRVPEPIQRETTYERFVVYLVCALGSI